MSTPSSPTPSQAQAKGNAVFVTTQWSQVLRASHAEFDDSGPALAALCQDYWYPLFAHVRRSGKSLEDAEDLTQAFFARLLEKRWLREADRKRGRFRTFLLTSLNHFLANEWDKGQAQKRGGGLEHLSFEIASAETRFQLEPKTAATPETEFNRRWALALLERVLEALQEEYDAAGKGTLFERLKDTLEGGRMDVPHSKLALSLGMSEGAVRVASHRLRQRYRELLRLEIGRTVATSEEIEVELRELFSALAA